MKIKPSYGLDISVSIGGYVRLGQNDAHGRDEQVILLSLSEIKILRDELESLIVDTEWWDETEQD